jgi:hypothetical protein
MTRDERPPHQLFDKCAECGDGFKAGDSIWISVKNEPICATCGKNDLGPPSKETQS